MKLLRGTLTVPRNIYTKNLLLNRLQAGDHQHASVVPESAVTTDARIGFGWIVGPVGLVVGDAVQPLDDRDVDRIFPVKLQALHCQCRKLRIV